MASLRNQWNTGFRMEDGAGKARQGPDSDRSEGHWCHAKKPGLEAPSNRGPSFRSSLPTSLPFFSSSNTYRQQLKHVNIHAHPVSPKQITPVFRATSLKHALITLLVSNLFLYKLHQVSHASAQHLLCTSHIHMLTQLQSSLPAIICVRARTTSGNSEVQTV